MPASDPAAERALGRLRRLPENRVCPNCLREERLGFQAICVRFRTFVCNDCKSAHQSFSHRCKEAAQSAWQMSEVRELEEQQGGGNAAARRRWLARVPDEERPTEGSPPEAFKRFVQRAYIDEQWVAEEGGAAAGSAAAETVKETSAVPAAGEEEAGSRRRRRHKDDSGEGVSPGGHHRRHRSRRRERREELAANGWHGGGEPAWPEVAGEGPAAPSGGVPAADGYYPGWQDGGWQDGPAGPTFEAPYPGYGEDACGPAQMCYEPNAAYPYQGPSAAWNATPASRSSPTDYGGSDALGWGTPSASTDRTTAYASPPGCLSFNSLLSELSLQQSRGPGGHRRSNPADAANPWAEAADLAVSPASTRATDIVIDATNPWADDVLRPKAKVASTAFLVGKKPYIGF